MNDTPIRTAVFGLGRMGWGSHFEPLAKDERYAVVAAADQSEENRERAAELCGCETFADAGEVLARAGELELELAVNALPSHVHVPVGIASLEAGVHTVIEKPLAPDTAGVEALIAAADKAGRHLLAHHNRRFTKPYCALRQAAERGVLGRIFQLTINMHGEFMRRNDWQTLRRMNGGLLRNHGTHWIDLALYVIGEPVTDVWGDCKLISSAGDAEDHAKILFRTESGCLVDITCSCACKVDGKVPLFVMYGTAGTLVSDSDDQFTLEWFDPAAQEPVGVDLGQQPKYSGEKIELTEEIIDVRETDTGGSYYDNVVEVLRRGGRPRVVLSQVLDVHRVIDRVDAGGVADWRPPNFIPDTSK
jgi:predicted dehydrogenase